MSETTTTETVPNPRFNTTVETPFNVDTDGKVNYDNHFNARTFERFVLRFSDLNWFRIPDADEEMKGTRFETKEIVYEAAIANGAFRIRAWSSTDKETGEGRGNGNDRIRFIVYSTRTGCPVMKKARQHNRVRQDSRRIWVGKCHETIEYLRDPSNYLEGCENCGAYLHKIHYNGGDDAAMACSNHESIGGDCQDGQFNPL